MTYKNPFGPYKVKVQPCETADMPNYIKSILVCEQLCEKISKASPPNQLGMRMAGNIIAEGPMAEIIDDSPQARKFAEYDLEVTLDIKYCLPDIFTVPLSKKELDAASAFLKPSSLDFEQGADEYRLPQSDFWDYSYASDPMTSLEKVERAIEAELTIGTNLSKKYEFKLLELFGDELLKFIVSQLDMGIQEDLRLSYNIIESKKTKKADSK